jgi:signal transduction histidine kinase
MVRRLDLQAKISLILVAVIVPTFVIVTIAENSFTRPMLEDEMRQVGVTSGKTIAAEIAGSRLLSMPNPTPAVEERIQELLYSQPNILRIDVFSKDPVTGLAIIVGSNIEEDPGTPPPTVPLVDSISSDFHKDEDTGVGEWEVLVPIEQHGRDAHAAKKTVGVVRIVVSTKLVGRIVATLWRTTAAAAGASVVILILVLTYFLRRTIGNERLLRRAETQNIQLAEQLHEAQRELMNTEKLAVMGQLTASFAHEIGTPLTAIGGHLSLLADELGPAKSKGIAERLEIINGQLAKIAGIVKGFLQSTAKPASQKQLVDVNHLVEKTLGIARPRMDAMDVEIRRRLDRQMGPLRIVPLDLEQILLNLVNNSLDSMASKYKGEGSGKPLLQVESGTTGSAGKEWAQVSVYDTGEGIKKADLNNVLKPFFTTKRPGEGTGLGLTICQQLAHKYGGELEVSSKEGAWTKVSLKIPYQGNA